MAAILGPHLQQARTISIIQEQEHTGPVKDSGAKELGETVEDKHLVMDTKPKPRMKLTSSLPKTPKEAGNTKEGARVSGHTTPGLRPYASQDIAPIYSAPFLLTLPSPHLLPPTPVTQWERKMTWQQFKLFIVALMI